MILKLSNMAHCTTLTGLHIAYAQALCHQRYVQVSEHGVSSHMWSFSMLSCHGAPKSAGSSTRSHGCRAETERLSNFTTRKKEYRHANETKLSERLSG